LDQRCEGEAKTSRLFRAVKPAYDLTDPDSARRFLNDDPAGGARWQPPSGGGLVVLEERSEL
jgi:hypothetical protein